MSIEPRLAPKKAHLSIAGILVALAVAIFAPDLVRDAPRGGGPTTQARSVGADQAASAIGFRSSTQLDDHFAKHGREFGDITRDEYLKRAQGLRDADLGADVLEARREDGVTTRFRRSSGEFVAFDRDRTIRTFFKPNDGERYFGRQAAREDER